MLRGTPQCSRQVPRDINVVFNSSLVIAANCVDERLNIDLKDVAVVQESSAFGFGPRLVARVTVPLRDFDGWVDLVPAAEVGMCAPPVLQIAVRVLIPGGGGVPAIGNTNALKQVYGSLGVGSQESGGLDDEPSAPLQPEEEAAILRSEQATRVRFASDATSTAQESGEQQPPAPAEPEIQPEPDVGRVAVQQQVQPDQQMQQVQVSGSRGVQPPLPPSPFTIMQEVFTFAPSPTFALTQLFDMQTSGRLFPFASAPFRDYNCFGAGWDQNSETYFECYKWPGHAGGPMPKMEDVKGCREVLGRVGVTRPDFMCRGVDILMEWLRLLEDTCVLK